MTDAGKDVDVDAEMSDGEAPNYCSKCRNVFEGNIDYHQRFVHQAEKKISWPDGESVVLQRSADTSEFQCPRCGYSNKDLNSLGVRRASLSNVLCSLPSKRHGKICYNTVSVSRPANADGVASKDDLERHPRTRQFLCGRCPFKSSNASAIKV